MSHTRMPWRAFASAIAMAALAACADERTDGPTGPSRATAPTPAQADSIAPGDFYPGEAEFLELARQIPGYAGDWYEGDTRVVALTDVSKAPHADAVLATRQTATFSAHPESKTGGGTRYVPARFDYLALRDFRDRSADAVLDVKGATFMDLDEQTNTLTVGIADEAARAEVEARFKEAGVPFEATQIVVSGDIVEDITLQQFSRPLQGGWQIQNNSTGGICTLGFITRNPANGANAFVTNSHCTSTYWGYDGAYFSQHLNPNTVGREVRDPGGFGCGFLWLWRCRYSDAALVQVTNATVAQGQIARTTGWAYGYGPSGSITVTTPALNITSVQNYPYMGQIVDKIGRTSGWTYGPVRRTCVTTSVGGWKRLLCQYFAYYTSIPGDSGSPVFVYYGSNVALTGLNWGHSPSERLAVFSPIGGVRNDLQVP